jgi:cytochrome oxidase Cu insertion factor (SCO1/SenC/PrrC family)
MISPLHIPKGITIICIALFGSLSLAAQPIAKSTPGNASSELKNAPPEIQPLSIGDKVPDIQFENILNYKSKKAKLSDFKGKLVILDMWSTSCTFCIAAFPKMEELQNVTRTTKDVRHMK